MSCVGVCFRNGGDPLFIEDGTVWGERILKSQVETERTEKQLPASTHNLRK